MSIDAENRLGIPADKEINLKYLCYFVLKKWRIIIPVVLAFMICGLLLSAVPLVLSMNNDVTIASSEARYNNEMAAYTSSVEALEDEIVVINSNLIKLKTCYDESFLMKIDPYHKTVTTLIYYIDSGFQIIPENTYQDIDYSSRLIKMYLSYLVKGELYTQLMEQFSGISDVQYIKEMISVSADYTTSMITISIISSEDSTQQIMDTVIAGMEAVCEKASETIIMHKLTKINDSVYTVMDQALAQQQQDNFNQISILSNQLQDKLKELKKLKKAGEPQWEYTLRSIVVLLVKKMIIAAVLGVFAMLLLLGVYYIVSDKMLDNEKLTSMNFVGVLGCIPRRNPKRVRALDKIAAAICGIKRRTIGYDGAVALTARSICATVLAEDIREGSVALAGDIGLEELTDIADAFNDAVSGELVRFTAAGDPMLDVSSIEIIKTSKLAILVVKQGTSRCTDAANEYARITAWGKQVLGAVVLDADVC